MMNMRRGVESEYRRYLAKAVRVTFGPLQNFRSNVHAPNFRKVLIAYSVITASEGPQVKIGVM